MALLPPDVPSALGILVILAGTAFVVLGKWPRAYTLGVLILAVMGLQFLFDGLAPLAFTWQGLREGAWWTPLTYMYLHAGTPHLIGNLFVLLTAGPALEDRVGAKAFTATYFAAGLAAAAAHVALVALHVIPDLRAVGASGAIFGVLTAFAVRYPRERLPLPIPGLGFGYFLGLQFTAFVILLFHLGLNLAIMFNDVFGRGGGGVAWYGHFAGYLVGLAVGVTLPKKLALEQARVPDVAPLRPLAKDAKMTDMLDKAAKFTGEHENDATFANAWVDRFLARATCPHDGTPLARNGYEAACPRGDYRVAFAPKR